MVLVLASWAEVALGASLLVLGPDTTWSTGDDEYIEVTMLGERHCLLATQECWDAKEPATGISYAPLLAIRAWVALTLLACAGFVASGAGAREAAVGVMLAPLPALVVAVCFGRPTVASLHIAACAIALAVMRRSIQTHRV